MSAKIDIDFLTSQYFCFDLPVPYILSNQQQIILSPLMLDKSEIFLSSVGLLTIDKNSSSDTNIIQMSYLQYIVDILITQSNVYKQQFINILGLCLNFFHPEIHKDNHGRPLLIDNGITITSKDFEDIKTIILYQNLLHYSDEYINPDMKAAMMEVDYLKNKDIEMPTIERKIAIITAHCGLSKKEQMAMTYRSHSLLFEEVCGEINYMINKPIAIWNNQGNKVENWIYKNKQNKMDNYFKDLYSYQKAIGTTN